jgi:hypothetical protein
VARLALFPGHPRAVAAEDLLWPPFLHPLRALCNGDAIPSVRRLRPAPSDRPRGNSWPASRRRVDGRDAPRHVASCGRCRLPARREGCWICGCGGKAHRGRGWGPRGEASVRPRRAVHVAPRRVGEEETLWGPRGMR